MSDKKESASIYETTTVGYEIGKGEKRKGLFTYHCRRQRDTSVEGFFAYIKELNEEDNEPKDPRKWLFERIEIMEKQLEKMSQAEKNVGAQPEPHTVLGHLNIVVKRLSLIRSDIEEFENSCNDVIAREKFYEAMLHALGIARALKNLTLKRYEVDILRGRDSSFNHKGASKQQQSEAVQRVNALMDEGHKKGPAVKTVATENGVRPQTVYSWIKKVNSRVVVTKRVVQDND